jgi:hypothetical protein
MKTYLVFKQNGEILECETSDKTLEISNYTDYNQSIKYDNYIILYNDSDNVKNITVFYFTSDAFFGDVALFKIDKTNKIQNINIETYCKKLDKIKPEPNELYYSSEEELFSFE